MAFKVFSFFSGSGFLDLGFEKNGYQIELVNEYSSSFIEAYKYSREKMGIPHPTYGYYNIDINDFLSRRASELVSMIKKSRSDGSLVGFVGGPPCPDFSIAGKQKGRLGDNGKLSRSYVDLIISQKPDFFIFENVKGLWQTVKHREYYEELKKELKKANYLIFDKLLNSLEFGVPQDRERIILFGLDKKHLNSEGKSISFPWDKYNRFNLQELKQLPWPTSESSYTKECPKNIPQELTVEYWFKKNDVDSHPNGKDCFVPRSGIIKMKTVREGDDSKKSFKRLHRWRYSPTVAYGNNEVHLHPYKERRLSVAEALSLQSLPKEFELPSVMSLTDKFKTIGNGVPFLLADGIAKMVSDFLDENCIK